MRRPLARTFSVIGNGKADFCEVKGVPPGRGVVRALAEEEINVASATRGIKAFML
jgi:hypothetical protein